MNRRDFLYKLGISGSFAIAGSFIFDSIASENSENPSVESNTTSEFPELATYVKTNHEDEKLFLYFANKKCFVNETGEKIIGLMDGRNNLHAISHEIADFYSIEHTDALQESVAMFICQLGEVGFLSSTFYITMYETY